LGHTDITKSYKYVSFVTWCLKFGAYGRWQRIGAEGLKPVLLTSLLH